MVTKAVKRVTIDDDISRLAERLLNAFPLINNRDRFDTAFEAYLEDLNEQQDSTLREKVFREVRRRRPGITPEVRKSEPKAKRAFEVPGKVKEKVVFTRVDSFTVDDRNVVVFRDRAGRFAKVSQVIREQSGG